MCDKREKLLVISSTFLSESLPPVLSSLTFVRRYSEKEWILSKAVPEDAVLWIHREELWSGAEASWPAPEDAGCREIALDVAESRVRRNLSRQVATVSCSPTDDWKEVRVAVVS